MRRSRKKYSTPRKRWERARIAQEAKLMAEYGLKTKRELWRAQEWLRRYRAVVRELIGAGAQDSDQARQVLQKLKKLGILDENAQLTDILYLDVTRVLERRLQTLVYRMGLANSIAQARQLITHGHILVGEARVSSPGYLVPLAQQELIRYHPSSPIAHELHPLRRALESRAE